MSGAPRFTGAVQATVLAEPSATSSLAAYAVTFEASARTHWHTHPCGQGLYVTEGTAWVQTEGSPLRECGPGQSVWIAAGVRHWHGASPDGRMTHLAYQQAGPGGTTVEWHEPVADHPARLEPKERT